MNTEKWLNKNAVSLKGKTVAITGATGGLGVALCRHLAHLNADILMLNRDLNKSQKLKDELLTEYPDVNVEIVRLNLSDINNVDEVCAELKERKIDFVILNAGIYNVPLERTESGFNNVFQVNFISHYHFVKALLPTFRKANTKVIAVGSIAHKNARLDERDVDYSNKKSSMKTYANSKRFLMLSLLELLKKEPDVGFAVAHPGVTATNMTTHYRKGINWFVKWGVKTFFPSAQAASLSIIYAMLNECPYMHWIGPKRLDVWGKPAVKRLKTCSAEESEKTFSIAEDIDGRLSLPQQA